LRRGFGLFVGRIWRLGRRSWSSVVDVSRCKQLSGWDGEKSCCDRD
jgi:hypothetical protein